MTPKERARENFKRALVQTTRALSALPEVEVSFGGEHSTVSGRQAKIPLPARVIDRDAAMVARGEADAAALRLAHHDARKFARDMPKSPAAQAVYRALEDARIEAIGARALKGVGDNLAAALGKAIADRRFDRLDPESSAPLPDVAALLLRQRLTGRSHPPAAAAMVATKGGEIESLAGSSLDALAATADLHDKAAFARLARNVIRDLHLDDEAGDEKGDERAEADDEQRSEDDSAAQTEDDGAADP
ncbi:MAG: cobaltochelatase subunit CobT, partial [Parvularculaceae bacterium]|nr:cobaltochelatase subunit CobT [Parvularculaceae bacterium]